MQPGEGMVTLKGDWLASLSWLPTPVCGGGERCVQRRLCHDGQRLKDHLTVLPAANPALLPARSRPILSPSLQLLLDSVHIRYSVRVAFYCFKARIQAGTHDWHTRQVPQRHTLF